MPTRIRYDERADIIEAAYSCMAAPRSGPVSVAAILDEAALSTRAFYRHFASKDELFLAMLRRDSALVARRLRRIADDSSMSPAGQLTAWVECLLDLVYHPRRRAHAMVLSSNEVRVAKGYLEASAELRDEREKILAEILQHGRADGSFPFVEPERDAAAIHALVDRAWAGPLRGLGEDQAELCGYVVDFSLRALGMRQDR